MSRYYRQGRGRGKAGISREIGAAIYHNIRVHDDGVYHYGGIQACIAGPFGSGKTTFLLQLAQGVGSMPGGHSKDNYRSTMSLEPETVIWRGRKYDYWNSLIASNWKNSFPMTPILRPVCVHVHKDDESKIEFYEFSDKNREIEFDGTELSFLTYSDSKDLCSHFVKGGINVVYEPTQYYLKTDVVVAIIKKSLEDLRLARLKRQGKGKKDALPMDTSGIQAPSPIFWYELLEVVQEVKQRGEYFSFFIDEASQVIEMNPSGELFHLGKWFADSMLDFRRNNISLFLGAQDVKDLDWRVTDKIKYYFWLPGSHIYDRVSQLDQPITSIIDKGEVIPEETFRRWGYFQFTKIPEQPPIVMAEGLKDDGSQQAAATPDLELGEEVPAQAES